MNKARTSLITSGIHTETPNFPLAKVRLFSVIPRKPKKKSHPTKLYQLFYVDKVPKQTIKTIIMANESYECKVCGYIYNPAVGDPDNGIAPGTKFEDLPEDWTCPLCGVGKEDFEKA